MGLARFGKKRPEKRKEPTPEERKKDARKRFVWVAGDLEFKTRKS